MRAKSLAILFAGFILCAISYAQDYSIRANRGLNLRTAPSLNADIAGTVSAGSVLQVVGQQGSWLQINRNGGIVWLANWVNYSRLDSSESSGSQQPTAPVDNCCGIDRQCSSDQEWTNGYWAFQNGQCAAPAKPVFSAPTSGGNCCSLGWTCSTNWKGGVEVEQGYWAYQINQCAGLPQTAAVTLTGPVPRIEGSSQFVGHITATLQFMKSVAPDWYNYVITGMDSIVEVPVPGWKLGDFCYARAYGREKRVTLESCWAISAQAEEELGIPKGGQVSTASALGHEACHIHTHAEGKHFATLEDEEAECRKFGTGARVLLNTALATGLDPKRGTHYFHQEGAIRELRRFCSEGYRADLFCPTLQKLEEIWRNVPYPVFPPGSPDEW